MILQPFPSAASCSVMGSINIEAPCACYFSNVFTIAVGLAKLPYLCFSKQNLWMLSASIVGFMLNTIHRISRAACPTQMSFIDTAAITATVGSIPQMHGTRAVNLFTNEPMNAMLYAINANTSVSAFVNGKRPVYTGIGFRLHGRLNKFSRAEIFSITHLARDTHSCLDSQ